MNSSVFKKYLKILSHLWMVWMKRSWTKKFPSWYFINCYRGCPKKFDFISQDNNFGDSCWNNNMWKWTWELHFSTGWGATPLEENSIGLSQWESAGEMDRAVVEMKTVFWWNGRCYTGPVPVWFLFMGICEWLVCVPILPGGIDELKQRITYALDNVTGEMLQHV